MQLENIVDNGATETVSEEKRKELNKKIQRKVLDALHSLTSEFAQINITLLIAQKDKMPDAKTMKAVIEDANKAHPLSHEKKL